MGVKGARLFLKRYQSKSASLANFVVPGLTVYIDLLGCYYLDLLYYAKQPDGYNRFALFLIRQLGGRPLATVHVIVDGEASFEKQDTHSERLAALDTGIKKLDLAIDLLTTKLPTACRRKAVEVAKKKTFRLSNEDLEAFGVSLVDVGINITRASHEADVEIARLTLVNAGCVLTKDGDFFFHSNARLVAYPIRKNKSGMVWSFFHVDRAKRELLPSCTVELANEIFKFLHITASNDYNKNLWGFTLKNNFEWVTFLL